MTIPPLHLVKSTNVAAVGHDGDALYVKFHGFGTPVYRYKTADSAVMDELLAAPSAGRYVQTVLKRAHEGELVVEQPGKPDVTVEDEAVYTEPPAA